MYKTILFPVDLNEESSWRKALPVALELCRTFGAKLRVITVVPDFGMAIVGSFFPEGYEKQALGEAEKALSEFVEANIPGDMEVAREVGHGAVYEKVIATAKSAGVDLIVMAAHRPGHADYLLGPNAARIVRHAECSVMVVRE